MCTLACPYFCAEYCEFKKNSVGQEFKNHLLTRKHILNFNSHWPQWLAQAEPSPKNLLVMKWRVLSLQTSVDLWTLVATIFKGKDKTTIPHRRLPPLVPCLRLLPLVPRLHLLSQYYPSLSLRQSQLIRRVSCPFLFIFLSLGLQALMSFFLVTDYTRRPPEPYFPVSNKTEALMLVWVTLVAGLLPDWALKSLENIFRDPDFHPQDLTRSLLSLRDLKKGPLQVVPQIQLKEQKVTVRPQSGWRTSRTLCDSFLAWLGWVFFFFFFSFFLYLTSFSLSLSRFLSLLLFFSFFYSFG